MIQETLRFSAKNECAATQACDSILGVSTADTLPETTPDDVDALKAALIAERGARREFQARAASAEAVIAHYKLIIAKMRRDRFGASSERGGRLLEQMERLPPVTAACLG